MIATIRDHTFFTRDLGPDAVVVDLGANAGGFATEIVRRFGVQCHAVEPSPDLYRQIPEEDRLHKHQFAITDRDAFVPFHLSDSPESSSLYPPGRTQGTISVPGRTFSAFLRDITTDVVTLVKIDIEGAERDLFRSTEDAVLQRVSQISIEFHDFTGLMGTDEILEIRDRLRRLGFYDIKFSASNMNWVFVQRSMSAVRGWELALARYVVRNARGLARRTGILPVEGKRRWAHFRSGSSSGRSMPGVDTDEK